MWGTFYDTWANAQALVDLDLPDVY